MDNQLEKDRFDTFLSEHLEENIPLNFTEAIMESVSIKEEKSKEVKPLIGKSTWVLLIMFILTYVMVSYITYEPINYENYLSSLEQFLSSLIGSLDVFWFYVPLLLILVWEFVFRRKLNIN